MSESSAQGRDMGNVKCVPSLPQYGLTLYCKKTLCFTFTFSCLEFFSLQRVTRKLDKLRVSYSAQVSSPTAITGDENFLKNKIYSTVLLIRNKFP